LTGLAGPRQSILRPMDRDAIRRAFDDVFDQALIFHSFTDYMRDYEVITYSVADPRTGIQPAFDRYLFRYCVQADVKSTLTPDIWRRSLDERLIDHETGKDLDGYVWGVKWQELYPGMRLLDESAAADQWSQQLGMPFHEAVIEANGHRIDLTFSDLTVTPVLPGYTPYEVKAE
jgi:hypothetical protein